MKTLEFVFYINKIIKEANNKKHCILYLIRLLFLEIGIVFKKAILLILLYLKIKFDIYNNFFYNKNIFNY